MKKKPFIGTAITITLLSLVWILLTPIMFPSTQAESDITAAHRGFKAPNFSLSTVDGETISLADYKGQPVLVIMWASWCSVCKATMPGLQTVYEVYSPRGFEILAVNTTFQDTLSSAENYFQSQNYTYKMLLDMEGSVSREYQIVALPTSILIAPDGTVLDVIIGSGMSDGFLRARLDAVFNSED